MIAALHSLAKVAIRPEDSGQLIGYIRMEQSCLTITSCKCSVRLRPLYLFIQKDTYLITEQPIVSVSQRRIGEIG